MSYTVKDLPADHRYHIISMSDREKYRVTENLLDKTLNAKTRFVTLPTGENINPAHIVSTKLDIAYTKERFLALPQPERLQVSKGVSDVYLPENSLDK